MQNYFYYACIRFERFFRFDEVKHIHERSLNAHLISEFSKECCRFRVTSILQTKTMDRLNYFSFIKFLRYISFYNRNNVIARF
jgi:hypothetical protein